MSIIIITQRKEVDDWVQALHERRPELGIRIYPDGRAYDDVTFAIAWNHPLGAFKEFRNLKCIASMGAGVDHILKDPDLPEEAIITRVTDENLTNDMAAFTLALVLNHIRGLAFYKEQQQQHSWRRKAYKRVADVTVGVMGVGVLGTHVASTLSQVGLKVSGWAKATKQLDGINVYAGEEELNSFLSQPDILICLLPLTKETTGILNKSTFSQLPKGAYIINVARGEHLVEEDLLEMLDNGHPGWRQPGCFPGRATAGRAPILEPSPHQRHPAHRQRHASSIGGSANTR